MSSLFQRSNRRQRDLARGVDADLVRDNGKRFKLAFALIASGFLLDLVSAKVRTPSLVYSILFDIGMASVVAGFLPAIWARSESAFLSKPDPKVPPTILKR
ncbi:MAG: hypothetical protein WA197_23620 [Candidatus Acidiferrales bacterium]